MKDKYTIEVREDAVYFKGNIPISDAINHLTFYMSQGYNMITEIDSDESIIIYKFLTDEKKNGQ